MNDGLFKKNIFFNVQKQLFYKGKCIWCKCKVDFPQGTCTIRWNILLHSIVSLSMSMCELWKDPQNLGILHHDLNSKYS